MVETRPQEFFEIVNHTLEEEGGYVNDPTDSVEKLIMVLVKEHILI